MKQSTTIRTSWMASLFCLLFYACTGGLEDMERLNTALKDTNSRSTEPVTASIILTQTGTLDAKLTELLGTNKLTVQNLTLSGPFNAKDVETLHTLTNLEKLDITNLETKYDSEYSYYNFSYTYEDSDWNSSNYNINGYLYDNQIGDRMFAGMASLKEITMPISVSSWGYQAFLHSGLTTVTFPEGITIANGFNGCTMLKTVNFPSTLKEIGYEAFRGCTALTNLAIPESVEKIDQWALAEIQLSFIKLPNALKEIGNYAFYENALTEIDIPASVTTLGYGVFSNCTQLKTLTIPATVTQMYGSPTSGCTNLQALIWNTSIDVPGDRPNNNCLLYINSNNGVTASYDTNSWPNTIVNGEAESIQLTFSNNDWGSKNEFSCPIAFKAKRVSLTMSFQERLTYKGKASGWRTLVVPFKVDSIGSETKGALAPFGSEVEATKPFWLRSLTTKGFVDATVIEANKPYIIAMPYNPSVYLDEYNISGNVTFAGKDVEITVTPEVLPAVEGPAYYLQPTYQYVNRGGLIYALNYNYSIRDHEYGSVFVRSSSNVYAYEAYIKPKSGSSTRTLYDIDTRSVNTRSNSKKNTTGIPTIGDM